MIIKSIILFVLVIMAMMTMTSHPVPSLAATNSWSEQNGDEKIIVKGDDGEQFVITLSEGPGLRIVSENGDEEVIEIDLSGISEIVSEATAIVAESLAEMSEMQIEMKLGRENLFIVRDENDEVMVNLEEVFTNVGELLGEAFEDFDIDFGESIDKAWDADDFNGQLQYTEDDLSQTELLQVELKKLRAELDSLREDLRRLQ